MGESGAWTTELLVMVVMASSLVSRKPSPKLVKEVCTVMTMGTMRKTARKKVPGNRYLPGMKRLVEYRAKIAAAASSTITSHAHMWNLMSSGTR